MNHGTIDFLYQTTKRNNNHESIVDLFLEFSLKFLKNKLHANASELLKNIIDKYVSSYQPAGNSDICSYLNMLFELNDEVFSNIILFYQADL